MLFLFTIVGFVWNLEKNKKIKKVDKFSLDQNISREYHADSVFEMG